MGRVRNRRGRERGRERKRACGKYENGNRDRCGEEGGIKEKRVRGLRVEALKGSGTRDGEAPVWYRKNKFRLTNGVSVSRYGEMVFGYSFGEKEEWE